MSPSNKPSSPGVFSVLPTAFFLAAPGCAGLFWVVTQTFPTLWPRWLFFFFLVLTTTGGALPFVALLNQRFAGDPSPTYTTLLRQALWVGLFVPTLAWLQIGRVLTVGISLLLALGFAVMEYLLRMNERSRWRPPGR